MKSLLILCLACGAVAGALAQAASPPSEIIIGSIQAHTIFRAKPGAATAEAWIKPGTDGMQSIFGVLADDHSQTLWACYGTPVFGPPANPPPPPTALYAFDLKTGAPKGHYDFPTAGGFCNDIAIGADGTAYATDTMNMEVVRLKQGAKALEVWAGNGGFGPKGGVLDGHLGARQAGARERARDE